MKFSTYDQDNDNHMSHHCAAEYKAAWWMNGCFQSSLNGPYSPTSQIQSSFGIIWHFDLGTAEALQFTEMKICRR